MFPSPGEEVFHWERKKEEGKGCEALWKEASIKKSSGSRGAYAAYTGMHSYNKRKQHSAV